MAAQPAQEAFIWRAAGGSAARRGLLDRRAPIHPQPARRLSAQGALQASVVFDGEGRALVSDMAGGVQAFSPQGKRLWQVQVAGGISATPVVHPEKSQMFLGTHAGWVFALDTTGGSILWQKQIPTSSDPRILSDLLYLPQAGAVVLSSWGGRYYALHSETGAEQFSWEAGISPSAAAAADSDGMIYCLRAISRKGVELVRVTSSGEESILYHAPEDRRGARRALVAAGPVLDEERHLLYFLVNRESGGQLLAWSLKAGQARWEHSLSSSVQAAPAIRPDGAIVLADLAGCVHALGPDGTARYRYVTGCEYLLAGGVSEAGGSFYLGDPFGALHLIDSQGQGKAVFEAGRSIQARPSFDPAGNLNLPCTDKNVYVFEGREGPG